MRIRLLLLVVLLLAVCLCGEAFSATYYIATTGNDNNPGTSAAPWATLQKAANTLNPGDTAYVQSGAYVGCRIGRSGAAGAPCTLAAAPGATVLINAPGPNNSHTSNLEIELYNSTVSYWVIDGFEIANAPKHGVDMRGVDHITIRNCYSHHAGTGDGIFMAFSYYPLLEHNECSFNGEHGIYQSNSGDYMTSRGNLIHDNYGCGQHMNGDRRYKPGDGLISYSVIEQNAIYNNGTGGGSAINGDGAWYSVIRNNVIYSNKAFGIALFQTDGAAGSSYNKVYNNTIVMAPNARDVVWIPKSKSSPVGNQVKNNILYTPDTDEACLAVYSPAALALGGSDYNSTTGQFSADEGRTYLTLAQWQAKGFDAHSFVAAPTQLFVDPVNSNYHLRAGSPAANTGTNLAPDVANDYNGTARPISGAYDLGAYEDW